MSSVAVSRLLADASRRKENISHVLARANCEFPSSSSSAAAAAAAAAAATSIPQSFDLKAIKECFLALAIISTNHVTIHSVESDDASGTPQPGAVHDDATQPNAECRQLFAESLQSSKGAANSLSLEDVQALVVKLGVDCSPSAVEQARDASRCLLHLIELHFMTNCRCSGRVTATAVVELM
jgi:hypothetical protein